MNIVDSVKLVSLLKQRVSEKNGVLFNAYVSGSHLYGFESDDSDIDVRGSFVLRKEELLGLKKPIEVLELNQEESNYDIVLFELRKMIDLAIVGNCNILEELNAPQLYQTADFVKLRQLINNSFGKRGIYNSYRGMAEFNYKKFILGGKSNTKKYLYVYRGLMAGIYVLENGIIQPNLAELNKRFELDNVFELIETKKNGFETDLVTVMEEGVLDLEIKGLFEKLDKAYLNSKIPDQPDKEDIKLINNHLVDIRLKLM